MNNKNRSMKRGTKFVTRLIFTFTALGISGVDIAEAQTYNSVLPKSNEQVVNAFPPQINNNDMEIISNYPCTCWVDINENGLKDENSCYTVNCNECDGLCIDSSTNPRSNQQADEEREKCSEYSSSR